MALAGNHDQWVTGTLPLEMLPLPRQRAELEWQRRQLSAEQLEWLITLPAHTVHRHAELWHGSADDPITGWIANERDAVLHLAQQTSWIGVVGHTHRPLVARQEADGIRWDPRPNREQLRGSGRVVLNPGAVTGAYRWLDLDFDVQLATWHSVDGGRPTSPTR